MSDFVFQSVKSFISVFLILTSFSVKDFQLRDFLPLQIPLLTVWSDD